MLNNSRRCSAAFFDLDHTLISEISGKALVEMAWKTHQISRTDIIISVILYLAYKLRFRDPLAILDEMVGWVRGRTEESMEELCRRTCTELLIKSVYPDAEIELITHRKNGLSLIMLSSSLDYICRQLCEKLGMDDFICSSLEVKDGLFTGRPSGRLCFGEEKLNRLTGYCLANNIDLKESWYYSDSISDLSVLEAVGNPVCINPDNGLNRIAERRGWRICRWSLS